MKRLERAVLAIILISALPKALMAASSDDGEQRRSAVMSAEDGIPIQALVRAVSKRTGKKYLIDSRVTGNVQLIGEEVSSITFHELLAILQAQGYTAVESAGFLRVIPETIVRQTALPIVAGSATYPDAQYVAAIIPVRKIPSATLVPILRPLLPQQAHLAAVVCSNNLIMVDTFANIRRIEMLVAALDTGDGYKVERCESPIPHP